MPWTKKQNALFHAAANNPDIARAHGMTTGKAEKMADEGIAKIPKRKRQSNALTAMVTV